jgi:hypothetical protein
MFFFWKRGPWITTSTVGSRLSYSNDFYLSSSVLYNISIRLLPSICLRHLHHTIAARLYSTVLALLIAPFDWFRTVSLILAKYTVAADSVRRNWLLLIENIFHILLNYFSSSERLFSGVVFFWNWEDLSVLTTTACYIYCNIWPVGNLMYLSVNLPSFLFMYFVFKICLIKKNFLSFF